MKYLLKRFWYIFALAILINIPLLVMGTIRTDQTVIMKGDTTLIDNFVEIEGANPAQGSLSSIYVLSLDHSTILQNLILKADSTVDVSAMSDSYLHFTDAELTQMGRIQHTSSITYALMVSYKAASKIDPSIHMDFTFDAVVVSYYAVNHSLRIGDRIVGINNVLAMDDFDTFADLFNAKKAGDTLIVERDSKTIEIVLDSNTCKGFGGYSYYDIDITTVSPKYTVKATNVGGPSGGLLQTLSLYNALIESDITRGFKIAGTGTIMTDGTVGPIGGIQQKIYTAFEDDMEIFLCPKENYEEALIAYNKIKNKERMKLYSVSTFQQALEVLANA